MAADPTLIRKHFYVSPDQVAKLAAMERSGRFRSSAQALRAAIDAFDPDEMSTAQDQSADLEAVFGHMSAALRGAHQQLAAVRAQLRERAENQDQALDAERERVRAYYRQHPEELEAIAGALRAG